MSIATAGLPARGTPGPRTLALLALVVLAAHALVMIGMAPMTAWMTSADAPGRPGLQARLVNPPAVMLPAMAPAATPVLRPRGPAGRAQGPASQKTAADTPVAVPPVAEAAQAQAQAQAPSLAAASEIPIAQALPASGSITADSQPAAAPTPLAAASGVSAVEHPATMTTTGHVWAVDPRHLPPPVRLLYQMTGQDRGLHYQANGEMVWQHDGRTYTLGLSVRAFLVGARHWRSRGAIGPQGLEPTRFSDTRRSEQATHFDRPGQRIVFSSNAPSAALQPGAQDQISLYVQLAAAMSGEPDRFKPGTEWLLQTATVRDALPWRMTLEQFETLQIAGESVMTAKWVCQPRQRFDARIEFWSSPRHHQMPARIRITQANGSFIDMHLREMLSLPALAQDEGIGTKTTSP
jgi:hypothetical protein